MDILRTGGNGVFLIGVVIVHTSAFVSPISGFDDNWGRNTTFDPDGIGTFKPPTQNFCCVADVLPTIFVIFANTPLLPVDGRKRIKRSTPWTRGFLSGLPFPTFPAPRLVPALLQCGTCGSAHGQIGTYASSERQM